LYNCLRIYWFDQIQRQAQTAIDKRLNFENLRPVPDRIVAHISIITIANTPLRMTMKNSAANIFARVSRMVFMSTYARYYRVCVLCKNGATDRFSYTL
jgi:hypothetical protein